MVKLPSHELIPFCITRKKDIPNGVVRIDPFDNKYFLFTKCMMMIDEFGFGQNDMVMPRWVFYDCAMMPGFAVGYGVKKENAPKEVLNFYKLDLDFYPLSMFILIPTLDQNSFFAHNLCTINSAIPNFFKGLGQYSKALGLYVSQASKLYGATQWNSDSLYVHLKFGEMEILSAKSLLHGTPHTLTYSVNVAKDPWNFRVLDQSSANYKISPQDLDAQEEINKEVQHGKARFFMLARDKEFIYLRRDKQGS